MLRPLRFFAPLLPFIMLAGCAPVSPNIVSEPLQPAAGGPVAYLVGSIGPAVRDNAFTHQRLMLRKQGTQDSAAAAWSAGMYLTPEDVQVAPAGIKSSNPGRASVFVLPLKPGDYEFYDTSFYWPGGDNLSLSAKTKFSIPMRLDAGKAYYIGEFRSHCVERSMCFFTQRDEQSRDEVIARRYTPGLPGIESLKLDLKPAFPFVVPAQVGQPVSAR